MSIINALLYVPRVVVAIALEIITFVILGPLKLLLRPFGGRTTERVNALEHNVWSMFLAVGLISASAALGHTHVLTGDFGADSGGHFDGAAHGGDFGGGMDGGSGFDGGGFGGDIGGLG